MFESNMFMGQSQPKSLFGDINPSQTSQYNSQRGATGRKKVQRISWFIHLYYINDYTIKSNDSLNWISHLFEVIMAWIYLLTNSYNSLDRLHPFSC